jgi:hypothetical protein
VQVVQCGGLELTRRILGILAVVAILGFSVQPEIIQFSFIDLKPYREYFTLRPDRLWPQYPRFLEGVRAQTQNGDSIALIAATPDWDKGYAYAYYRASYILAGREVLPLSDSDGRPHPENYRRARYVAVWAAGLPRGPYTVVWQGEGGALLSTAPRKRVSSLRGGDRASASLPLLNDVPASLRRGASHLPVGARKSSTPFSGELY